MLSGDRAGETGYRIDRAATSSPTSTSRPTRRRALQVALAAVRSSSGSTIAPASGVVEARRRRGRRRRRPSRRAVPELPALPVLRAPQPGAPSSFHYRGKRARSIRTACCSRRVLVRPRADHGHDELRTYRVDRIEGGSVVGERRRFERPAGSTSRRCSPPTQALRHRHRPHRHGVRVSTPTRAALVEREVGSDAARGRRNGAIEVDVPAPTTRRSPPGCSGSLDHAEVLSPKKVREASSTAAPHRPSRRRRSRR